MKRLPSFLILAQLEDRRVEEFVRICPNPGYTGAVEVTIERVQEQAFPVPRMHSLLLTPATKHQRDGETDLCIAGADATSRARPPPLECIECMINARKIMVAFRNHVV